MSCQECLCFVHRYLQCVGSRASPGQLVPWNISLPPDEIVIHLSMWSGSYTVIQAHVNHGETHLRQQWNCIFKDGWRRLASSLWRVAGIWEELHRVCSLGLNLKLFVLLSNQEQVLYLQVAAPLSTFEHKSCLSYKPHCQSVTCCTFKILACIFKVKAKVISLSQQNIHRFTFPLLKWILVQHSCWVMESTAYGVAEGVFALHRLLRRLKAKKQGREDLPCHPRQPTNFSFNPFYLF